MSAYGESLFLSDYDDGGTPESRDFDIPGGGQQSMPASTLKHHRPLGHKKVILETEAEVMFNNGDSDKDDPSNIRIMLKRGLRRHTSRMKIRVEYNMRKSTEGVARLRETLLDRVQEIPMTDLEPSTPIQETPQSEA